MEKPLSAMGRVENSEQLCERCGLWVQLRFLGGVEVERVSTLFRQALDSLMTKRNSPLTVQMFVDLCNRFPVSTLSPLWRKNREVILMFF